MAEGAGGIQQHKVQLSVQSTVLQTVIHHEDIRWIAAAEQLLCTAAAIRVLGMWNSWYQQLQHLLFVIAAICRGAIAAADDSRVSTLQQQQLTEQGDDRSFSGAAGGEVADADDGDGGRVNRQQAVIVQGVADGCRAAVAAGGHCQHPAQGCRPQSAVFPADQSEKPGLIHGDGRSFWQNHSRSHSIGRLQCNRPRDGAEGRACDATLGKRYTSAGGVF